MKDLLLKYDDKLVRSGMAEPGSILLGGLDDSVTWNRIDPLCPGLEEVLAGLSVNSILFARPAEPYFSMISLLAGEGAGMIRPSDCETRTFLHDIPVASGMVAPELIHSLRRRKSVVVPGRGVVTWGTVSPEQAFITFSSVCFACFVKFFSDCLEAARGRGLALRQRETLALATSLLDDLPAGPQGLAQGPFTTEAEVRNAMAEAGLRTVELRLVDSFFGNISYLLDGILYISQTTSSLDELAGAIDACPLDGSACTGITASSEYSAHVGILRGMDRGGVLHGHPRFSVIMSMLCGREGCSGRGSCHIRCPVERLVEGIPVVPGEVGTGPYGLCNSLPRAMEGGDAAMVYGHGVFARAGGDFRGALGTMLDAERACRTACLDLLGSSPSGGSGSRG